VKPPQNIFSLGGQNGQAKRCHTRWSPSDPQEIDWILRTIFFYMKVAVFLGVLALLLIYGTIHRRDLWRPHLPIGLLDAAEEDSRECDSSGA
jgi:hypothetical protein